VVECEWRSACLTRLTTACLAWVTRLPGGRLMQLSDIRHVYDGQAPFATVYLEGRTPAEDAQHQVRLRWEELRRGLVESGAEETALGSLDDAVLEPERGEVQSDGRVLVADATGVLL